MKKTAVSLVAVVFAAQLHAVSPHLSKVWKFCPAPGQFTNMLPQYEEGDEAIDMCLKATDELADDAQGMVTLGGWGGYIVFSFDHPVVNVAGEYDFIVLGNAFYSNSQKEGDPLGGSCEPGIVCVSYDANGNGKPDDEWYELAGSEYNNPQTKHNYSLVYMRPDDEHAATPSLVNKSLTDTTYIEWADSEGGKGYMYKNSFHNQPYFPEWVEEDELGFTGTLLPQNYVVNEGNYTLFAYNYGYADNHPNGSEGAQLKLDWAVDSEGQPVNLPCAHFFKVYTGLNQQCGWLGETSTEITGATDLHPEAEMVGLKETKTESMVQLLTPEAAETLILTAERAEKVSVYDHAGRVLLTADLSAGTNSIDCTALRAGVYVIRVTSSGQVMKCLKK